MIKKQKNFGIKFDRQYNVKINKYKRMKIYEKFTTFHYMLCINIHRL